MLCGALVESVSLVVYDSPKASRFGGVAARWLSEESAISGPVAGGLAAFGFLVQPLTLPKCAARTVERKSLVARALWLIEFREDAAKAARLDVTAGTDRRPEPSEPSFKRRVLGPVR